MVRHGSADRAGGLSITRAATSRTRQNWIAARGEAFCAGRARLWSFSEVQATQPQSPKARGRRPSTWCTCWARASGSAASRRSRSFCTPPADYGATPDPYAVRTMQRFSRVALVTVLVLAGSGIASAWLLVGERRRPSGDGTRSPASRQARRPRAGASTSRRKPCGAARSVEPERPQGRPRRRGAWHYSSRLEAGLVLVLLGLAAAMTETTPARPRRSCLALAYPTLARGRCLKFRSCSFLCSCRSSLCWRALAGACRFCAVVFLASAGAHPPVRNVFRPGLQAARRSAFSH